MSSKRGLTELLLSRGILDGGHSWIDVEYWMAKVGAMRDEVEAALRTLTDRGLVSELSGIRCGKCGCEWDLFSALLSCPVCGMSEPRQLLPTPIFHRTITQESRDPSALVLVHGMTTLGDWQELFTWRAAFVYRSAVPVFSHKYGWDVTSPLTTSRQARRVEELARRLRELSGDLERNGRSGVCDVIAHSFGTLLVAELLRSDEYRDIRLGRVVLTGSIVPSSAPFERAAREGRVECILNHRAGRDFVVTLAPWCVPGTASTGRHGFVPCAVVREFLDPLLDHSGFFGRELDRSIMEVWTPFLANRTKIQSSSYSTERARDATWWSVLVGRCVLLVVLIGVASTILWATVQMLTIFQRGMDFGAER